MTALKDIRSEFLEFFATRDNTPHAVVPSAPLIPQNDPTLLFVNAGMVPFKNLFTGVEKRDYVRATSSQKCVRAGGKHNDLDNVGYTARHHTFFEMLGNFSFGDYFKEQAIESAWTLLTQNFALPKDRLTITVYHTDDEAYDLWRKIADVNERQIIRISTDDNFWAMGDTGPCGPCSEIFYDHGDHIPGGPPGSPDEDGDRFIEIWNLVFMQYERRSPGDQVDLPRPSIDTGMGLERIAAVLQGVHDNYDVDIFQTLINASVEFTNRPAKGNDIPAHRVIADHLRSSCFLIADGVSPSNEGRGYVLRRIMRRAMRYAHSLGAKDPLLARMAPILIDEMGTAFPELQRASALIQQTLNSEEQKFHGLLDRGVKLLHEETKNLNAGEPLPGNAAFKLYDTYGFPLDLTQDALRREGRSVDVKAFKNAMEAQKTAARAAWAGSGDNTSEAVWFDIREENGATEFLGYIHESAQGNILAIIKDGEIVDTASAGDNIELFVNQTPFYAESGGQAGDQGIITSDDGAALTVKDVKKRVGSLHGHLCTVDQGNLKIGDTISLTIDKIHRDQTRANHSATHLVHTALRNILGPHVTQKGSLVTHDRLRFDFSHPNPVSAQELRQIETQVNAIIRQNHDVSTKIMPYDDAVESGAIALFGEKYDSDVRVLSMGQQMEEDPDKQRAAYSVELCGGTHVKRTGDIALFTIVSESAVAAGIRRIEALTAEHARQYYNAQSQLVFDIAGNLKTAPHNLAERITTLIAEKKQTEKDLAEAKKALALGGGSNASADTNNNIETINGIQFSSRILNGIPAKELRGLIDQSKNQIKTGVIILIAVNDDKAAIAVGVTDDLTDKINAVDLVRIGVSEIGGKGGGGRPDLAQAGGPDASRADLAIKAIADHLG